MSTARVGSLDLYYEEHGSGPPLLLVMGLAADSTAWMFQVPDFEKHFRTIVFDNRGVGRSAKPPGPYTIHEMADDAAGLLNALEIRRAHVVGVSMGGMIAQELALRHPEHVQSLVLACTFPEPDADIERQRRFSLQQFGGSVTSSGEMQVDVKAVDPMQFLQLMLPTVFNEEFIVKELPKLIQVFSGALQYGFSLEAILGQVAADIARTAGHQDAHGLLQKRKNGNSPERNRPTPPGKPPRTARAETTDSLSLPEASFFLTPMLGLKPPWELPSRFCPLPEAGGQRMPGLRQSRRRSRRCNTER